MQASRVLFLGDANVGKTTLIERIASDEFNPNSVPTTAARFVTIRPDPNDQNFDLQIWDTAGMERYRSVNKIYFRDAVGAILVFDFTSNKSFSDIEMWKSDFLSGEALPNAVMLLAGNKYDKSDEFEVSEQEVISWAEENGIQYFAVSALTGQGVSELVEALSKNVPRRIIKSDDVRIMDITDSVDKKKGCC